MSWFSAAVSSVSKRFFDVPIPGRAREIEASLLAAVYKNRFEQVLDEIKDLSGDTLTSQDLNNLKDILTKNSKSSEQQLENLELFKENLNLIKEMKTSFSYKDVLSITKSQITFGDYVYKSSSSGNKTVVGWCKDQVFVYGNIAVKDNQGSRFESGEFEFLGLNMCKYALKNGTRKIEKNGVVAEIQSGIFIHDDSGNVFLHKGKLEQGSLTIEGYFKLINSKLILFSGSIKVSDVTFLTVNYKSLNLDKDDLLYEGEIIKKTKDQEVTRIKGIFKYNQETDNMFLVQGTKTLHDGTIYYGEFYWDKNSKTAKLLKGTIKYLGGTTEDVTLQGISNRKV